MLLFLGCALYHDQDKRKWYFLDYPFKQKMSSCFLSNWIAFVHLQFFMLLSTYKDGLA